ncbi:MAG: mevalonate kinase [Myxococcaceae bacterium]
MTVRSGPRLEHRGFAPGKVIVLGEHAAVYGHPALAAPLSRGVEAVAVRSKTCEIAVPAELSAAQSQALQRAFKAGAAVFGSPKVRVEVTSRLPVSVGLGSSGALSVACARALAAVVGEENPAKILEGARAMEGEFHGQPSGVDHTTSATGEMVIFQRGKAKVVIAKKPVEVVVAISGPRASTKSTVAALRERQARWPERYARLFTEVGRLVKEGAESVRRGDLDSLGDLMNLNHGLLTALGLASESIDAMVRRLRKMGALGAKLTGAGGDGGAVIGLFKEPELIVQQLRAQGIDAFASHLAGPRPL